MERGMKKAIAAAINKTASDLRKEFIREMIRKFGVDQRGATLIANTRLIITRAREDSLKATIRPTRRVVPLIFFNAVQERSMPGTSIEFYRGQQQMLPHAFIPKNRAGQLYKSPASGLPGVFKGVGAGSRKITLQGGVPMRQLFSEVIPEVDKKLQPTLTRNIQIMLSKPFKN